LQTPFFRIKLHAFFFGFFLGRLFFAFCPQLSFAKMAGYEGSIADCEGFIVNDKNVLVQCCFCDLEVGDTFVKQKPADNVKNQRDEKATEEKDTSKEAQTPRPRRRTLVGSLLEKWRRDADETAQAANQSEERVEVIASVKGPRKLEEVEKEVGLDVAFVMLVNGGCKTAKALLRHSVNANVRGLEVNPQMRAFHKCFVDNWQDWVWGGFSCQNAHHAHGVMPCSEAIQQIFPGFAGV
jgi:hypothetical protein